MKVDEREVEIIIEDLKAGVVRNRALINFPGVRFRQQLLDRIFEEQGKVNKVDPRQGLFSFVNIPNSKIVDMNTADIPLDKGTNIKEKL